MFNINIVSCFLMSQKMAKLLRKQTNRTQDHLRWKQEKSRMRDLYYETADECQEEEEERIDEEMAWYNDIQWVWEEKMLLKLFFGVECRDDIIIF